MIRKHYARDVANAQKKGTYTPAISKISFGHYMLPKIPATSQQQQFVSLEFKTLSLNQAYASI